MKNLSDLFPEVRKIVDTELVVGNPFKINDKDITLIPLLDLTYGMGQGQKANGPVGMWVRINPRAVVVIKQDKVEVFSLTGDRKVEEVIEKLCNFLTKTYKGVNENLSPTVICRDKKQENGEKFRL